MNFYHNSDFFLVRRILLSFYNNSIKFQPKMKNAGSIPYISRLLILLIAVTNAEQKNIQTNVVVGKQDPLQLLPDFQLTLSFLVPTSFSAEDLTKSDEHLLTKRIQLHLQDAIQAETDINNSNVTAYIYMKSTNRNLQQNSLNLTTISRQFSGFIRAAVDDIDVNNITNDAFQTTTIQGAQFLVNLRQDAVTTSPNSILRYLYSYTYHNTDTIELGSAENSIDSKPNTLSVSTTIVSVASLTVAFAFGLLIGGLLLLNLRQRHASTPIHSLEKQNPTQQSLDGMGLSENFKCDEKAPHISIIMTSSIRSDSRSVEDEEQHLLFSESTAVQPVLMEEASEGRKLCLKISEESDYPKIITIEPTGDHVHSASEHEIENYYTLLEDPDIIDPEEACYQLSSSDNDSNDDINTDEFSDNPHPSVCSLEKIIVYAKVASEEVVSSASSTESNNTNTVKNEREPTTPDDAKNLKSSTIIVSPSTVVCDIPAEPNNINNDDLRSVDEKENNARFFESVWNEKDDESLQSYIPRIINIPVKEEEDEVVPPPQIHRHENMDEFVLLAASLSTSNEHTKVEEVHLAFNKDSFYISHDRNANHEEKNLASKEQADSLEVAHMRKGDSNLDESCQRMVGLSDSLLLGTSEDDSDSSGVMFSSISYQASFIHGSTRLEDIPCSFLLDKDYDSCISLTASEF